MPKELTHWLIAEHVLEGLSETPYGEILKRNKSYLMLGSIYHDLFYLLSRSKFPKIGEVADRLHGVRGENTFNILEILCSNQELNRGRGYFISFIVGIITHIFTDSIYHPFIYYHTGKYFNDDFTTVTGGVQRHRRFEVVLDMLNLRGEVGYNSHSRVMRLDLTNEKFLELSRVSNGIFPEGSGGLAQATFLSWKTFSFIQNISKLNFTNKWLYAIESILPNNVKEITSALYIKDLKKYTDNLSSLSGFIHPVTGEKLAVTLSDLLRKSVDRSIKFCKKYEEKILDGKPLKIEEQGPSLEVGIEGVPANRMVYFSGGNILAINEVVKNTF